MDRQTLLNQLAQQERRAREGALLLQQQREIFQAMISRGEDVTAAKTLLEECERTQATYVADRDRLRKLLAQSRSE